MIECINLTEQLIHQLTEQVTVPVFKWLDWGLLIPPAYEMTHYIVMAVMQVLIVASLFRVLEYVYPIEYGSHKHGLRLDRRYTLLKLFIIVPLMASIVYGVSSSLAGHDISGGAGVGREPGDWGIQNIFPTLKNYPVLVFVIYYLIYDFAYYWIHRLQHMIPWWWALHSLHHSQTQLNCWSNDRDHYLDDLLESLILAALAMLIGVAPYEYALLVLAGDLIQDFSHTNTRVHFGRWLEKLFVSPRYHRLHHAYIEAHTRATASHLKDCNYALVFPIWDIIFGTASFAALPHPTGVADELVAKDNQLGLLQQQLWAFQRFKKAILSPLGWRPGIINFSQDFR